MSGYKNITGEVEAVYEVQMRSAEQKQGIESAMISIDPGFVRSSKPKNAEQSGTMSVVFSWGLSLWSYSKVAQNSVQKSCQTASL